MPHRTDPRAWILLRSDARPLIEGIAAAAIPVDRRAAVAALLTWIFAGRPGTEECTGRLTAAGAVLDETPGLAERFRRGVAALPEETDVLPLLTDAGIPGGHGVLTELGSRLLRKLLPSAGHGEPVLEFAAEVLPAPRAAHALGVMPAEDRRRLFALLGLESGSPLRGRLGALAGEAVRLLCLRLEALTRERALRVLLPPAPGEDSPFRALSGAGERFVLAGSEEGRTAAAGEVLARIGDARTALAAMRTSLAAGGVSLNAVYGLVAADRSLERLEALVRVLSARGEEADAAAMRLLSLSAAGAAEDRRVRDLLRWNLRLLDMKIVERSGKTGEHYVAHTRDEYRHIGAAAAWGGLLTTLTAAFKLTIASLGLPLFQEGLLAGLNYAVSFLLLQRFGWMLATKQPAMTAAAMAAIVREHRGEERIEELVEFATRISRSQLLAAGANILLVTAGAVLLDLGWTVVFGRDFLPAEKADRVLTTLNPFLSATAFYAALTGVILWLASLAGGWFENFSVYNRMPQGIAAHPAGRFLGRERLARFAASWRVNIAGWATNVSLGFLLGLTPVVGAFLGLPFDVRHVTLSTGMFALAAAALDVHLLSFGAMLSALLGIGLMFTLNLSVSFILSLFNAAFAYGLSLDDFGEILRRLALRALRRPRDFFLPPRTAAGD